MVKTRRPGILANPSNGIQAKKCKDAEFCKNGGRCFVNLATDANVCVCPEFTTGDRCQNSHVFTLCPGTEDPHFCDVGGLCIIDNLTGDKRCMYKPGILNSTFDGPPLDIRNSETKKNMSEVHATKIKFYNLASVIVGAGALFGIIVIAVILFRRRRRENNGSSKNQTDVEPSLHDVESCPSEVHSDSGSTKRRYDESVKVDVQEPLLRSENVNERRNQPLNSASFCEEHPKRSHIIRVLSLPSSCETSLDDISGRRRLFAVSDNDLAPHPPKLERSQTAVDRTTRNGHRNSERRSAGDKLQSPKIHVVSQSERSLHRTRSPTISDVPLSMLRSSPERVLHKDSRSPKTGCVEKV